MLESKWGNAVLSQGFLGGGGCGCQCGTFAHLLCCSRVVGWHEMQPASRMRDNQQPRQLLPGERGKGEPMLLRIIRPQINSSL